MGANKSNLFGEEENNLAVVSKALGHPARIAILKILTKHKGCICGDISDELPLAQSTISQHLKVLKEAGLIHGEVEGAKVCYSLNPVFIQQMHYMLTVFTSYLSEQSTAQNSQLTDIKIHKSISIWDHHSKK